MTAIIVDDISIDFPIYDLKGRSIRRELFRFGAGGDIRTDSNLRPTVAALQNVSFSLHDGDRIGLIGHNGAGKSTLLRALAGIFEPASGTVQVSGTVAPLFDIIIGMDNDLSGYDNVFLRGLLMGFTRAQMSAHLEEIEDFCELGEFMRMPIRTYSSGMLIRLAFAIITTAPADILLMDEVIGAGDAAFQEKAEKRLERYYREAGIIVVASHNSGVLRAMCNRGLVLNHGRLCFLGDVEKAIEFYESSLEPVSAA